MRTLPIFSIMVTGGQGVVHKCTIRYDESGCSISLHKVILSSPLD